MFPPCQGRLSKRWYVRYFICSTSNVFIRTRIGKCDICRKNSINYVTNGAAKTSKFRWGVLGAPPFAVELFRGHPLDLRNVDSLFCATFELRDVSSKINRTAECLRGFVWNEFETTFRTFMKHYISDWYVKCQNYKWRRIGFTNMKSTSYSIYLASGTNSSWTNCNPIKFLTTINFSKMTWWSQKVRKMRL